MTQKSDPNYWKKGLSNSRLLLVLVTILLFMAVYSPSFVGPGNLINLLSYISINGMLAVGMTLLMISREFDISIGSVVVLAGVISIHLIDYVGAPWAIVLGTGIGMGTGAFNGLLVVRLGINSFIALTDMRSIATESATFHRFSSETWWGLPLPVLYFFALSVIIWFISRFTLLGKHAYAIGGSPEACHLMGIPVGRQKLIFFVITGTIAAFSGVVLASRLNSASAVFGENIALVVIAAIVIGGVHLSGGTGTVGGVVQGVLLLGLLENVTVFLEVSDYYQRFFRALVLIGVVVFDVLYVRYNNFTIQRQLKRLES